LGAPVSAPLSVDPDRGLRDVDDPDLQATVARALRNYLAKDSDQLAADLARGARWALPDRSLTLTGLDDLKWSPGGDAVIALVRAQERGESRWTLRYEVDVARLAGRWEIGAIEMRPN
jgi:hypothetical protein